MPARVPMEQVLLAGDGLASAVRQVKHSDPARFNALWHRRIVTVG